LLRSKRGGQNSGEEAVGWQEDLPPAVAEGGGGEGDEVCFDTRCPPRGACSIPGVGDSDGLPNQDAGVTRGARLPLRRVIAREPQNSRAGAAK